MQRSLGTRTSVALGLAALLATSSLVTSPLPALGIEPDDSCLTVHGSVAPEEIGSTGVYAIASEANLVFLSLHEPPEPNGAPPTAWLEQDLRLTADLDLGWCTGFRPIGSRATPFTGSLDGDGRHIEGLRVDQLVTSEFTDADDEVDLLAGAAGLFGVTLDAEITGVSAHVLIDIEDEELDGASSGREVRLWVGGLVGYAELTVIEDVELSGDVRVISNDLISDFSAVYVGGIVGVLAGVDTATVTLPSRIDRATSSVQLLVDRNGIDGTDGALIGVGGAVGHVTDASVDRTVSTGHVVVERNGFLGGFLQVDVGGSVGWAEIGVVARSRAAGDVVVTQNTSAAEVLVAAGGFAGSIGTQGARFLPGIPTASALVVDVASTGAVVAADNAGASGSPAGSDDFVLVGGLFGFLGASILQTSFSSGDVTVLPTEGTVLAGALGGLGDTMSGAAPGDPGDPPKPARLIRSYASGEVSGADPTSVAVSRADSDVDVPLVGGGEVDVVDLATLDPVTPAQLRTFATFQGEPVAWQMTDGWAVYAREDADVLDGSPEDRIWGICPSVADGFPFLLWEAPENPCVLTPAFGAVTATADGFTATVTNYDPAFTWAVGMSGGTPELSVAGVLTVTGLDPGAERTVTVSATRVNYATGTASITGAAIAPTPPPVTSTTPPPATPPPATTTPPSDPQPPAPAISCSAPVVGTAVSCTLTGAAAATTFTWEASSNPVFATGEVTTDAQGSGTFSFLVPESLLGIVISVEVTGAVAPTTIGEVAGPLPVGVPAGQGFGGPGGPAVPALLVVALISVVGVMVLARRRLVAG